ncbi:MAG: O-antigen ligase family protein [Anaerolineaceae bacterium]|nr:O-antigen ligase family protein [Anaerolineaceae bacterium]
MIRSALLVKKGFISLFLYALFIIITPFYFWRSGVPQIADFVLMLLVITFFIRKRFVISGISASRNFLLTGFIFSFYVVFVNLIWALILSSTDLFLLRSSYYIYNISVCIIVIGLYADYREQFIEFTYKLIWASLTIQCILYLILGGFSGLRTTIFFNNPNQLGYFALLAACIILFASSRIQIKLFFVISGLIFAFFLIAASQSRGAILAFLGLVLLFLMSKGRKDIKKKVYSVFIIAVLLFVIIYQTTTLIQDNPLIQTIQRRIESIGSRPTDSLEGRGYHRITDYPEYWIFGAGEGEFSRFGSRVEFHSTIGNIQVSYGIIGSFLFFLILFFSLKNDHFINWYSVVTILFYGLTHNGIRNSLFWILLALMACGCGALQEH